MWCLMRMVRHALASAQGGVHGAQGVPVVCEGVLSVHLTSMWKEQGGAIEGWKLGAGRT